MSYNIEASQQFTLSVQPNPVDPPKEEGISTKVIVGGALAFIGGILALRGGS